MSTDIGIYYEHPRWFEALFQKLDDRKISYEKIDAALNYYDPEKQPAFPLLFNRMSASAYLRGSGNAIFYTISYLENLERLGVRVLNGSKSFQLEISKALQASLLASLGIGSPNTRIVNSPEKLLKAAAELTFPVLATSG